MADNRLRNPLFGGVAEHSLDRAIGPLLPHWGFEHKANEPFLVHAADSPLGSPTGLSLEFVRSGSRLRVWQEIRWAASPRPRSLRAVLEVRKLTRSLPGLTIEWVTLLEIDPSGKRVFAVRPPHRPILVESEHGMEIRPVLALPPRACAETQLFAIQLSGGPGGVRIDTVALFEEADRTAEARPSRSTAALLSRPAPPSRSREPVLATLAAPAPAGARSPGPARLGPCAVQLDGGTISGTVELPGGEDEILGFIDGKLIGAVKLDLAASGDTPNFRLPVPDRFRDGGIHSIGIRRVGGQRLGNVVRLTLDDRHAVAAPLPERASGPPPPIAADPARRRICVISWDMGHNPAGRAFLLADMASATNQVQLCGPCFPAYGTKIWPPIANTGVPVETFPAPDFATFLAGARSLASRIRCDVVHVSKLRFPSLLIGALIKQANQCPMIVDIDDHELGFFAGGEPASLGALAAAITAAPALLDQPYGEIFTRYAESLAQACDGITVSNCALQARFGGIVVRHGRDERLFDPAAYDRRRVRAEYGYCEQDRVILFLGTPRPHKGVFGIADALESRGDDRLALCIIGSIGDKRVARRFATYRRARISLNPDQPWSRLPELVMLADAVFLLQDPASPISEYQIPAKLSDALAMGVPVYATPVPPLADLIAAGAITPIGAEADLQQALEAIATAGPNMTARERARNYYLGELSYAVNGARIDLAIDRASRVNRRVVPEFDALFDALETAGSGPLPRFGRRWGAPAIWKNVRPDLVFLWKQNDSDLYGRRPDMIVKYLLRSGAVNRILHFDAPISLPDLEKHAKQGDRTIAHQGKLVYLNSVRRILRLSDSERLIRRTFLHRTPRGTESFLGIDLPQKGDYPDFIRATARAAGLAAEPILWVSPVVFDYPEIKAALDPSCVVADIVDDQRSFEAKQEHLRRIERAYEDVLVDADLVFANCQPLQAGFAQLRPDILLVPNGAEPFDLKRRREPARSLSALARPVLGYVGNLRDRIDLVLVQKIAQSFPEATLVLIGSAHDRPDVLALNDLPNVRMLGVKPYEEALDHIRTFDVAIMPHSRNALSDTMNPLKLYVYFALNVPIVTTDVANIGDLAEAAVIAPTHDAFIAGVRDVLAGKVRLPTARRRKQIMDQVSWTRRIDTILQAIGLDGQAEPLDAPL